MERADWLEERVDAADARFRGHGDNRQGVQLPDMGPREVRKLHAELAEIAKHASDVLKEHQAAGKSRKKKEKKARPASEYRGVFGSPAW